MTGLYAAVSAFQSDRAEKAYSTIMRRYQGIPEISEDAAIVFRSIFAHDDSMPAISSHGNHHELNATMPIEAALIEGIFDEALPKAFGITDRRQTQGLIKTGVGQNFICLGSPSSNAHAKLSLGYQSEGSLDPIFQEQVRLYYWYEPDKRRRFDQVWRRYPSGLRSIERWIIKDCAGNEYVQRLDFENTLIDDFLLISCVPQPYSRDSALRSVVVGGAHGLGSTGVAALVTDLSALQHLATKIKAMNYWQALIHVSGLKNGAGSVIANGIKSIEVKEVVVA